MRTTLRCIAAIAALLLFIMELHAQTVIEFGGQISENTTWSSDTVKVTADVTISNGKKLTINPGTVVLFMGHHRVFVKGQLYAEGTKQQRIKFIAKNKVITYDTGGWNGIEYDAVSDSSSYKFCDFEYSNGFYRDRGGVFYIYSSDKIGITDCHFSNNRVDSYGGAIGVLSSNITVANTVFTNNSVGYSRLNVGNSGYGNTVYYHGSTVKLVNCLIYGNKDKKKQNSLFSGYSSNIYINNSTIAGNKSVFEWNEKSNISLTNSIIWDNENNINIRDNYIIKNSIIQGSYISLNMDPVFDMSKETPYQLLPSSPCIDAAESSLNSVNTDTDVLGNSRIYNSSEGGKSDLGAFELQSLPENYISISELGRIEHKRSEKLEYKLNIYSNPKDVNYTLQNAPLGLIVRNDSLIWQPEVNQEIKEYNITLKASNSQLETSVDFTLNLLDENSYIGEITENMIWKADTIRVIDDITVQEGVTLTVNAGTTVLFNKNKKIIVNGVIITNGEYDNRVVFTSAGGEIDSDNPGYKGVYVLGTGTFTNTIFEYATYINFSDDGGAITAKDAQLNVSGCLFRFNKAYSGSAIFSDNSDTKITNSLFHNNESSVYFNSGDNELNHSTIVNDEEECIKGYQSNLVVRNSILWGNNSGADQLGNYFNKDANIKFCIIQNGSDYSGTNGNSMQDPKFKDADLYDFSLTGYSPAINGGDESLSLDTYSIKKDYLGNDRISQKDEVKRLDIGAFEYPEDLPNQLHVFNIEDKLIRYDSLLHLPVLFSSYPSNVSFSLLNTPNGVSIVNDSLVWTPTQQQAGKYHDINVIADNGELKDTMSLNVYVGTLSDMWGDLSAEDFHWKSDTIKIFSDINLGYNETIDIDSNVCVQFQGNYTITGSFNAIGTAKHPVIFTAKDKELAEYSGGWDGLILTKDSKFKYCNFEYGNSYSKKKYGRRTSYGGVGSFIACGVSMVTTIENCKFHHSKNSALDFFETEVNIVNSLFYDNYQPLKVEDVNSVIDRCTFVNNQQEAISIRSGSTEINNSILWANNSNGKQYKFAAIEVDSELLVSYSDMMNNDLAGDGNISVDPEFLDDGTYRLSTASPCVNSANPAFDLSSVENKTDLYGNIRVYDKDEINKLDMGAVELQGNPASRIHFVEIENFNHKYTEDLVLELNTVSYPKNVIYRTLNEVNLSINEDTVTFKPTKADVHKTIKFQLESYNGFLRDTVEFDVFIAAENDYWGELSENVRWSGDTVNVIDDINITNRTTLTIDPGVFVSIKGHYEIDVKGRLLSEGTPENRITFMPTDTVLELTSGGWNSIVFDNVHESNDTSKICYTDLKFSNSFNNEGYYSKSGGALNVAKFDKLIVSNNTFYKCNASNNGGAINTFSDIQIINNKFILNSSRYDGSTIYVNYADPLIYGNIVKSTDDDEAIYLDNSSSLIANNTIVNENSQVNSIYLRSSSPTIVNNILLGKSLHIDDNSTPILSYNITNLDKLDGAGNINTDPKIDSKTFIPSLISFAINKGSTENYITNSTMAKDIYGNDRIYTKGIISRVDIGAVEIQSDPESYISILPVDDDIISPNAEYELPISVYSYPASYTSRFIEKPEGLLIENDTIKWTPSTENSGNSYAVSVEVDNSEEKDTLKFNLYVKKSNDFLGNITEDLTWSADTINILGNIQIDNGVTLTVNPGTYVRSMGNYKIDVKGCLIAEGTSDNMITFTSNNQEITDESGGWSGLMFNNVSNINDTSKISYCNIEYYNARTTRNYAALSIINFSKLTLNNNTFKNNKGYNVSDIYLWNSDLNIISNIISDNSNISNYWNNCAVYIYYGSHIIMNNVVTDNNNSKGIFLSDTQVILTNNTIVNNSSNGIYAKSGNITIANNIVWGNNNGSSQIGYSSSSNIDVSYSNIQNNEFTGEGNISIAPKLSDDYSLSAGSPCIDAGNSGVLDGISTDIIGNDRILDSSVDMGAFERVKGKELATNLNCVDFLQAAHTETKSDTILLKIYGKGELASTVSSVSDLKSPFKVNSISTPTQLETGDSLVINVTLDRSIDAGNYKDTIHIQNDFKPISIPVTAEIINKKLECSNNKIDFGIVNSSLSNHASIVSKLTNSSNYDIHISEFNSLNFPFSINLSAPLNISSNSELDLIVDLNLSASPGEYKDTLIIKTDANDLKIPLYANIVNGRITSNVSNINFGQVKKGGSVTGNSVTIENIGDMDVEIQSLNGLNSPFSFTNSNSSNTTSSGDSYPITINFDSNADEGLYTDTLHIESSANNLMILVKAYVYTASLNTSPRLDNKNFTVFEDLDTGSSVGDLNAVDDEGDDIYYSIISGNSNNTFEIDKNTGNITLIGKLDFETNTQYNLLVKVSDQVSSSNAVVTINVKDVFEGDITPSSIAARMNAVSFTIGNTAYIGLGENSDNTFKDFWKFNEVSNEWTEIAEFPGDGRKGALAFVVDGKAYVGLGVSKRPYTYYKDFYCYDPSTNAWTKITDFGGDARFEAASFVINGDAYVGTGKTADVYTTDFWKYSVSENTWTKIADLTEDERSDAIGFEYNGKGYIIGGMNFNGSSSMQLSDVMEYDPATNSWKQKLFADGINLSFNDATSVKFGNKVYIMPNNGDKVAVYNITTNKAESMDILTLKGRDGSLSFSIGDNLFYGMGAEYDWGSGYTYFNNLEKVNIPVNNVPYDITLSNNSISENNRVSTQVGWFETSDIDNNDSYTYTMVSGEGDTDNDKFEIRNNFIYTTQKFNFEDKSVYTVRVKTTDQEGAYFEKILKIVIKDINEKPNYISLSNKSLPENSEKEFEIGTLSASDDDHNETFTFALEEHDEYNDNNKFLLAGDKLRSNAIFNYEDKKSYNLKVSVTDSDNNKISTKFTINVTDVNEEPTNLTFTGDTVKQGAYLNLVGTFSVEDEDAYEHHEYTFVSGDGDDDNDSFTVEAGGLVKYKESFDFTKTECSFRIKVTDLGGNSIENSFSLKVKSLPITSVKDMINKLSLNIHPNPVSDKLNIKYTLNNRSDVTIQVFDSFGKTINNLDYKNQEPTSYTQNINFETLNPGVYYVRFVVNSKISVLKFIKR